MENLNFDGQFKIKERISLSVRAEFVNIFNRTHATSTNALAALSFTSAGPATAGFGYMNTSSVPTGQTPRQGQLVARFRF